MSSICVYNISGEKIEEVNMPDSLANIKVSVPLLHEVVTSYLSNQRQGTHSTKTRAEVSGGGRKPWRQKGTGRARAGSIRSPLWRKGGIIFGPKPRSYRQDISKKKKELALLMGLKQRCDEGNLILLRDFMIDSHKTNKFYQFIKKFGFNGKSKMIFIVTELEDKLKLAGRNLRNFKVLHVNHINIYDIMSADKVLFIEEAFKLLLKERQME